MITMALTADGHFREAERLTDEATKVIDLYPMGSEDTDRHVSALCTVAALHMTLSTLIRANAVMDEDQPLVRGL